MRQATTGMNVKSHTRPKFSCAIGLPMYNVAQSTLTKSFISELLVHFMSYLFIILEFHMSFVTLFLLLLFYLTGTNLGQGNIGE